MSIETEGVAPESAGASQEDGQSQSPQAPSQALGQLRDTAKQLVSFRGTLAPRAAASAPAPASPPTAAKPSQAPAAGTPATDPALTATLAQMQAHLQTLTKREAERDRSERIRYVRSAGLRSDIGDDIVAAVVGKFDTATAEGRNAFENFRKSNSGLFVAQERPEQRAQALNAKVDERFKEAKGNRFFGAEFAKKQIAKSFGGGK